MSSRWISLTGILIFLLNTALLGFRVDDRVGDRPILASEKKKLENLILKAKYFETLKSDSCILLAKEALSLAKANGSHLYETKALEILGDYYYEKEQFKDARDNYRQLIGLYKQQGDSLREADIQNRLGLCYYNLGMYSESLLSYQHAVRLAMEGHDTLLQAKSEQNIGVLFAEMKRPKEAMQYYRRALDLHRKMHNQDDEAGVLQDIGIIYADQKNNKEALGYYLSALKIYTSSKDSVSMALIYLDLGSLYEDERNYTRALDYYNQAMLLFTKEQYRFGLAYGYYSQGSVYYKLKDYDKAIALLHQSLDYSRQIDLAENEADCHHLLSKIYADKADFSQAYGELLDYEELNDKLYGEKVQNQVADLQMQNRTRSKDQEIANLKSQREKAVRDMVRRTIGLISIVTLTFIVIVISVYYSRSLKRTNDKLKKEVNEKGRAQRELLQIKQNLESRVNERTHELEVAKMKAEESDRLKSAFIANMSHEIRTPLNAITGFSGLLLRDDISTEKKAEYNDQIIKNNRILVNLIEDMIDASRIESGSLQLHMSPVNPDNILSQLTESIFENMARKNKPFLKIVHEKPDIQTLTVLADAVRVQQVLWHLLDNAIKFTEKGVIRYGCYENHQNMIFYINDTGIGIPTESAELIFEKFRQLDTSVNRKYGGTGLGLYYARKIADVMGGRIWYEPKKEGGSIFYFSIPVRKS